MTESRRKRIFAWACFDFANSAFSTLVVTFIYSSLFVKSIALEETDGTRFWSNAVAVSSILLAVLSPALGAVADAYAWKKRMMIIGVILCSLCTAALYFPQQGDIVSALALFVVANVAIELSVVFNNAFLPEITSRETQGKVSGQAWALGYVGGLLCLGLALVGFVFPEQPWFGLSKEGSQHLRSTNVLVAVWVFVFSLPMFFWVKEKSVPKPSESLGRIVGTSFYRIRESFTNLRKYKALFWMLIARAFYNDGIVVVFSMGGIYATTVFGFSFEQLLYFGLALNVCSALGAFLFSFVEDRIGSRMTISVSILGLLAASVAVLLVQSQAAFWLCSIVVGFFAGPNQSASRAYMGRLCPPDKANEFFGFFAFSGKATAFLGPWLFGQLSVSFDSLRAGMAVVPVLLVVGLFLLLSKAKNDVLPASAPAVET